MTVPMFKHECEGNAAEDAIAELEARENLYELSKRCQQCKEPINSVEEALLISRADGSMCLTHFSAACYSNEIHNMIARYISAPRVRWIARATTTEQE